MAAPRAAALEEPDAMAQTLHEAAFDLVRHGGGRHVSLPELYRDAAADRLDRFGDPIVAALVRLRRTVDEVMAIASR